LPPLFIGSAGDVAVDSTGAAYWEFFPRYGNVSLGYLGKLGF
jgi:hypothetical protein